jgi:plasmid stabilization system protein ParE
MIERVVILAEAERDVAEARDWYEGRRDGLGREFVEAVNACVRAIQQNAEMFEVVHEDYRRALVERFPYMVFYEASESKIVVHGIFHCARDPQVWRHRLR